ncbi:MAG: hypothetical protein F4Y12_07630 [Acidimicrobiaceae bacterium]|nr:hypothetical protein [Acidimicrobiaceae bacterium]
MSGRRRVAATTAMRSGVPRRSSRREQGPESNFGPFLGRPEENFLGRSKGAQRHFDERGLRDKLGEFAALATQIVLLTLMFVLSSGRSGWAVLATGALVASLLAVAASPVGAAIDEQDNKAKTVACVGDALGDQMFTDVSDMHAFSDAINCVAYYGITNGTGDGSTYSPNDNVTRAEMAVFIARAAGAAGVDLGDATGQGFTDIGDIWAEAQDAINQLAGKDIIDGGGEFRPGDDITRVEMASFLIGLLAAAAPNVTIDSNGAILLGESGSGTEADDHFGDVRATQPVAADKETAALYELGVTNGASPAAGAEDGKAPLDTNYEPDGTVNRGEMAAFITRALAHTSVRPEGVSAQYDGSDVVISVRDENFAPVSNALVDAFTIDTGGVDLAFRADGSCTSEVTPLGGEFACEIDGMDGITGGDGDTREPLSAVASGGSTVWVWSGESDDKLGDTVPFRLDISEDEVTTMADKVRVTTEFAGEKAHLGSSVLYTAQLQSGSDDVSVGTDGEKPADLLVALSTHAYVPQIPDPSDTDPSDGIDLITNPAADSDGYLTVASVVTPVALTTNSDGKATFSVSGLPDTNPDVKGIKYKVNITLLPRDNAPAAVHYQDGATAITPATSEYRAIASVIFSTEASDRATADARISVKTAADHVVASDRGSGASNSATVTVTDQYGDPIAGARVTLSSGDTNSSISDREFAVGRDGSYTFRYTRDAATGGTELLTATYVDGDDTTTDGTATDNVEWATPGTGTSSADIREFDKDTNTIFVGADASVNVLSYDSNDRFNLDDDGTGGDGPSAATYAAFEKALANGRTLGWTIVGSGSRDVNSFTLTWTAS